MKCLITMLITSIAGTLLSILGMFLNWTCCSSGGEDTVLSKALLIFAIPGMATAGLVDSSGGWLTVGAFIAGTFIFWLIIGFVLGLAISLAGKRTAVR